MSGAPWSGADVDAVLRLMRPKPSPVPLVRLGGDYDGAYLVPDDLDGVVACFSPGVNNVKQFEDELASAYGIRSHLCDFTSDEHALMTPLLPGMQTFEKKWLDVDGATDSISLDEWVARREPTGDLMLQMDIEGAEFRNILGTSRDTLRRFRVIVIEVHGIAAAADIPFFSSTIGPLIRTLDEDFVCVHAHPNNCCGEVLHQGTGMNLPGPIELTYLRRDRFAGMRPEQMIEPSLPHPQDILRNVSGNPPLFLNAAWSDRPRSAASRLKMETDRLSYLRFALDRLEVDVAEAQVACELAARAVAFEQQLAGSGVAGPTLAPSGDGVHDLASGRPFWLSSALDGYPLEGTVRVCSPFFFHTGFGTGQSITIDLGSPATIVAIEVENRTDMCWDRIRALHACFHLDRSPTFDRNVLLELSPYALREPSGPQLTVVPPVSARFVTLFSPADTALHLAAVRVFGRHRSV